MDKKILILLITIITTVYSIKLVSAAQDIFQRLVGYILLQVQSNGEAWYVNPADSKKYYLGRPTDAFDLMRYLSIGITNDNLAKIPVGLIDYNDLDDDQDGLTNRLENALGTDPENADSDGDGFGDKVEILSNYNPLGDGAQPIDKNFTIKQLGKIFLQTEMSGEAWYINPADQKRYYLDRPADAFKIMQLLSLGINNENLAKINTGYLPEPRPGPAPPTPRPPVPIPPSPPAPPNNASQTISAAASAIRSGNKTAALSYFIPDMQKAVAYTMDFLDKEGKFTLGNIMSGAKLTKSTDTEKTYTSEVYFSLSESKIKVNFNVKKQNDGTWLLTNL